MTDYNWEIMQRQKQKDLFLNFRAAQTSEANKTLDDRQRFMPTTNDVIFHYFIDISVDVRKSLDSV